MFPQIPQEVDIAVVGLGPAGSSAALACAKAGLKVLALDRRQEIGSPVQCGEGLSKSSLERMGLDFDRRWMSQEIIGARVYAPNEKSILIDYEGPEGWVIERKVFDKMLAKRASSAGAMVLAKTAVTGLLKDRGRVSGIRLKHHEREYDVKARIVIAADGVESKLAREAGIKTILKLIDVCTCAQFEMSGIKIDSRRIEFFFGNKVAPGGYCLTHDTEIITKNTLKPIASVKPGEEALTLNGWVPATATSVRDYEGEIISIIPQMLNNKVKMTPDHLVYIWNKKDGFVWKKASELKKGEHGKHRNGDYLLFPVPNEKRINYLEVKKYAKGILYNNKLYPIGRNQFGAKFKYKYGILNKLILTNDLMEFFGYYIAEGNVNSSGIIISSTDPKLVKRVKKIGEKTFGVKAGLWEDKHNDRKKVCTQVAFPSKILRQLFKSLFKEGCHNKRLPNSFFGLDDNLKISLLIGLFKGDGNKYRKRTGYETLNYTTVSKSLIYDLWMFLSTMGIIGAIGKIRKKNAFSLRIYGRQLDKLQKIFGKCVYGKIHNNRSFIKDGFVLMGVRELKKEKYKGKVYDIQSGGSFCPGFIVHNCWIFPKGGDTANVGIGIRFPFAKDSAINYLKRFVRSHPGLNKGSIIETNCGAVPVGGFLDRMVLDNFMVVGDAARHVNPIHGGGISEAFVGGRIAGEIAVKAIKRDDTSESALKEYEKLWWAERGNKLKKILKLREVIESLSDQDLNWIAEYLQGEDLVGLAKGSSLKRLAKIMMKKPRLLKFARKLL